KTPQQYDAPAVFFKADGSPMAEKDILRQPDLAKSYRAIAENGTDWFYRGPYSQAVAAWMKQHGGIMTEADFANYVVKARTPFSVGYHDYEIVCFPPPSSGGVHVAQIMNILENFDLKDMTTPGAREHVIAEAMKL